MTAIRTSQQNAYEGILTAEMGPNDLTAVVDAIGILTTPCYVVIEMDSDAQREYIFFDGTFTGTTFVTLNIAGRYLAGSAAGSNLTHPIGSKVRTYVGKQHHDDIHDRIDNFAHDELTGLSADDHPQYSLADGSRDFTAAVGGVTGGTNDLATKGYVDGQVAGGIPTGIIMSWAAASAPGGYLLCDGAEVSRATYAALFAVIASDYGDGNGTTTFDLPDLRGRFPLGLAASGTGSSLGETGGTLDPTIDIEHDHALGSHTHDIAHSHADNFTTASDAHTHTMPSHTHATSIDHNHGAVTSGAAIVGAAAGSQGTSGLYSQDDLDTVSDNTSHTHTLGSHDVSGFTASFAPLGVHSHTHDSGSLTGASESSNSSTASHFHLPAQNAKAHTHSTDLPNFDVGNVTSTSVDPGDAQSDSHSHGVNGSVTDNSGNSGSASGTSDVGLSDSFAVPNAAYIALEFIIKT